MMMMMMMMITKVMEASVAVETWRSSILSARFLAQYLSGSHPSSFACWRRLKSLKSYEMCQWAAVSSFCCSAYRVSHRAVGFPAGLQTSSSFLPSTRYYTLPLPSPNFPNACLCCWMLIVGRLLFVLLDPFLSIQKSHRSHLNTSPSPSNKYWLFRYLSSKHPPTDRRPSTVRPKKSKKSKEQKWKSLELND